MTRATAPAYKGIGMEGWIATWYAALTRKGIEDFRTLAREVSDGLPPQASVLEVAPGPGYFAIELAKLGPYQITGLDISRTFVKMATRNAREAGVSVNFRHGNASVMPFAGDSFDFLLCRAAFKNFAQPLEALREIYRILKPGGRALIIDLRRDSSRESISRFVDTMGLGRVNAFLTKLIFRHSLLKRAYTSGEINELLAQTNFGAGRIRETLTGMEIRLVK